MIEFNNEKREYHTLRSPSQSLVVRVSPAHRFTLAGLIGFRTAAEQLEDLLLELTNVGDSLVEYRRCKSVR